MRIAHVSPYDHQVAGGVREHVTNLTAAHRALGHDATIVAPASHTEGLPADVICASTTVVAVPGAGSIARISPSPAAFRRVKQILRGGAFDVVHIHEPLLPMVSLSALYHARTPTVGTIHGYRPRFALYQYLQPVLRRMMDRLSARVAVSVDAREWVSRYFPGEYHVIPDGVDVARFADPGIEPVERFADERPTILFVGRLEPRKGLGHLLDALPRVEQAVPGTRLVVAGAYGERDRDRWASEAARRGAHDVVFVGPVSAEDLPRYYRTADVFCAPSTGFEALGIVLLEAMAAGTPVVTTDIAGYRTVVRDGRDAVVVPPEDAAELARALVAVLTEPDRRRRLAQAGRKRAWDYDWASIAQRLVDLYEECRRGRNGQA